MPEEIIIPFIVSTPTEKPRKIDIHCYNEDRFFHSLRELSHLIDITMVEREELLLKVRTVSCVLSAERGHVVAPWQLVDELRTHVTELGDTFQDIDRYLNEKLYLLNEIPR